MMKEEVKEWIERAKKDLIAAKNSLNSGDYEWSCFQIQQSVEKALKALILKENEEFPKIHDLVKLAKIINAPEKIIINCGKLNPHYVESRYPNLSKDYSNKDTKEFINLGEDILRWIEENL